MSVSNRKFPIQKVSHLISLRVMYRSQRGAFWGCVIEGSQQIYFVILWYWGSRVSKASSPTSVNHDPTLTKITVPLALLLFVFAIVVFIGLPDYYHQVPGQIPSFYKTIPRRKIILVSTSNRLGTTVSDR